MYQNQKPQKLQESEKLVTVFFQIVNKFVNKELVWGGCNGQEIFENGF